jgi:Ca-activated chloride channel family protein
VVLRYTQLLNRDGDALRVRYAAGDRGEGSPTFTVDVKGEAQFATPYSPTHSITTDRRGSDLRVTVGQPVRGDVELLFPYRRGLVGGSVLTHSEPGEDGFALLFLAPPLAGETPALSRDLTLVVDVSGSMSGEKIDQAKAALRQALSTLAPRDRFRLISFSNGVRQFREGFTPTSSDALEDARRFVDGLAANGGTNLAGAIETALAERPGGERLGIVLLLTDGLPTVGEQAPERIAAEAGARIGNSRIFTIGVGTDVNTYLLDRLAVDGRGSASYVAPGVDVGDAMGTVLTRISRPALTDLRIVESPVRFQEQAPSALPDLFYGEELVVLARYRGEGNGPVVIEGARNGRRGRFTIAASFGRNASADYIPPLWAARRIGELTRQIRLDGASPDLVARVRELGLRYGILTEYTSYLVQEPGSGPVPPPMPAGAPMARQMTGAAAFDAAKASANLAGSGTRQAAEAAVSMRFDEMRDRTGKELRRGGGKVLVKREGVWTDVAFKDGMKIRSVAPFSPAYFALVKARPGLRAQLAIGHPLVLAGGRIALRIAEDGVTQWGAGELDRFLAEYEGR